MVGNRIRPLKKLKKLVFCILHSSEGRLRRQKWGRRGGTVTIIKSAGGPWTTGSVSSAGGYLASTSSITSMTSLIISAADLPNPVKSLSPRNSSESKVDNMKFTSCCNDALSQPSSSKVLQLLCFNSLATRLFSFAHARSSNRPPI